MRLALAALALLIAAACSAPAPPPTPIPPTAIPATPTPAAQTSDVENAFLSNVDDLIAEANDIASTPCDDLVTVTRQNPALLQSLRGFAATMKRASTSQAVLNTQAIKDAIADLDKTMGQLDGALSVCGIPTPNQP